MADRLTFVITPDNQAASIDLFFKALDDIRRLLHDIDYAMHRERTSRRWIISGLHASAPTITVSRLLDDKDTIATVETGIRKVTLGTDQPPEHFSEQVLTDLIRMRRLFHGKDRARSIMVSSDSQEPATIGQDIRDKANRILSSGYWNLGTIEGKLEAVSFHGSPKFTIWDRVSRAPVHCAFRDEGVWKSRVKDSLERRVLVKGRIRYFINGIPRSISSIESIIDATPDPNLPKADFGSIPDQEAARDPVEFLRRIRAPLKE